MQESMTFLGLVWILSVTYFTIAFALPMVMILVSLIIHIIRDFKMSKLISVPRQMWDVAIEELFRSISRNEG